MSLATRKKKPTGKAVAQDLEEGTTFQGSEPLLTTETTPPRDTVDPPQEIEAPTRANRRTQLEQNVASALGAPVSLTDEQFRVLLERLAPANSPRTVADSHPPLTKGTAAEGFPNDDPSEDPSDHRSDRGSRRQRRPTSSSPLRYNTPWEGKRSPRHAEPPKLDDGRDPTYT